ncbi:MAG: hypothetical protein OXL40_10150 [Bacteroidota bacterium]|nr:hypothetical protein [Bacteroidota bacterium]
MLSATTNGLPERSVECFDDGAQDFYVGDMNSWPVLVDSSRIRCQSEFFQRWPDDMSGFPPIKQLLEFPMAIAAFALGKSTRMVPFIQLDQEWSQWSEEESCFMIGLNVASNQNLFRGRSTI